MANKAELVSEVASKTKLTKFMTTKTNVFNQVS